MNKIEIDIIKQDLHDLTRIRDIFEHQFTFDVEVKCPFWFASVQTMIFKLKPTASTSAISITIRCNFALKIKVDCAGGDLDFTYDAEGKCRLYVTGSCNGTAILTGSGDGDCFVDSIGSCTAIRRGKGSGDAVRNGHVFGRGNCWREDSGDGDAKLIDTAGFAGVTRLGSGAGGSYRDGILMEHQERSAAISKAQASEFSSVLTAFEVEHEWPENMTVAEIRKWLWDNYAEERVEKYGT